MTLFYINLYFRRHRNNKSCDMNEITCAMKMSIAFLFLLSIVSCSQISERDNSEVVESHNIIECYKSVAFGDVDVCLPVIDGMTECYSHPNVKMAADGLNYPGNSILGYYLNNSTYQQVDRIFEITFDDYFQIYASNELKGMKVGRSELDMMAERLESNYIRENWSDLAKEVRKNYDFSMGVPILIDSYSPNKDIRTFVMLTKIQFDDDEFISLTLMNIVRLKERLIWMAYYKNYAGEESIGKAKSKNDYLVLSLIDVNK